MVCGQAYRYTRLDETDPCGQSAAERRSACRESDLEITQELLLDSSYSAVFGAATRGAEDVVYEVVQ